MADNVINTRLKFTTEGQDTAVQAVNQLNTAAQTTETGLADATKEANQLNESLTKSGNSAELLRKTGGALSQLGLGGVGQVFSRLGDIKEVGKVIEGVASKLPDIGAKIPIIGAAGDAITGVMGATVTSFLAAAAPIAAITIAIKVFTDTVAAQTKLVDDTTAALKSDTDARLANIEAIHTATAEQIQSQIEIDKAKLAEVQAEKAYREQFLADIQQQYADLGSSFDPAQRAALGLAGEAAQKSIDDLITRENELTNSIKTNTAEILPAVTAREKEEAAIQASADAAEDHAKAEEDLAKEREKAAKELADIKNKEAALNESRQAQLGQRIIDDNRAGAESVLQAQIDAAKEVEAQQQASDQIVAIRQQAAEAEIQAQNKVAEAINKANDASMQSQLKLLQNYINAEKRATEDYSRERVRKLEDLYASLNDLAANRDVAGFVNARKAGFTDIARGDEDAGIAAKRRKEDYERQSTEEAANLQRRLVDIQAAAQVEAQQRATQLAQRIQQEQAAGQQVITQSQILQNQLAALRESWAKQDLAARRKAEDTAYTTQLTALQQRQQALTNVISQTTQPVVAFFGNVATAIVNMVETVKGAFSANTGGTSNGSNLKAYAGGTPYLTETGPIIGHKGERIVTASENRSRYMPQRSSSRGDIHIHVDKIGEVVTPSQLDAAKESIVSAVETAIRGG